MTEDAIRKHKRNQQAAGPQAVMGGTEESTAAAKVANNQAMANTTSAIAAAEEQQKDKVEQEYLNEKNNLNKEFENSTMKSAEEISKAAQGVGDVASSLSFLK